MFVFAPREATDKVTTGDKYGLILSGEEKRRGDRVEEAPTKPT